MKINTVRVHVDYKITLVKGMVKVNCIKVVMVSFISAPCLHLYSDDMQTTIICINK